MQHLGDEREGDEAGDDESIGFDLSRIPPNVTYLCFCINSFSGQELNDVKDARCRLYNTTTLDVACEFDMTSDKRLDCTALLMCIIFRSSKQHWHMQAVGEPAMGRTAADNVDEFQACKKRGGGGYADLYLFALPTSQLPNFPNS